MRTWTKSGVQPLLDMRSLLVHAGCLLHLEREVGVVGRIRLHEQPTHRCRTVVITRHHAYVVLLLLLRAAWRA